MLCFAVLFGVRENVVFPHWFQNCTCSCGGWDVHARCVSVRIDFALMNICNKLYHTHETIKWRERARDREKDAFPGESARYCSRLFICTIFHCFALLFSLSFSCFRVFLSVFLRFLLFSVQIERESPLQFTFNAWVCLLVLRFSSAFISFHLNCPFRWFCLRHTIALQSAARVCTCLRLMQKNRVWLVEHYFWTNQNGFQWLPH